ncbi:MAG: SRPBCC family protein [Lysobacterales bacterium CG02_land_8_20_14_3_00_62_12]|nr:MAG: SRPBCC family protein [Xanthomonadales bacterium CG02_land_8_20_14_3_00_62_12]PJA41247.1 MAG: SRPBCC family protein [Xanthomonadales bacterium CG_4_9_14_3_um_filter_62_6]
MQISQRVCQPFDATPELVFGLLLDGARFAPCFRGCGPIPGIRRIELLGPVQVGSVRRIENTDGSVLGERLEVIECPQHHAYTLSGFRPPFSWLVHSGAADWRLRQLAAGTEVCWCYRFTLTSVFAYPLGWPLLKIFMRCAMTRCLRAMARELSARPPTANEV